MYEMFGTLAPEPIRASVVQTDILYLSDVYAINFGDSLTQGLLLAQTCSLGVVVELFCLFCPWKGQVG